jgi:hypothetical protein
MTRFDSLVRETFDDMAGEVEVRDLRSGVARRARQIRRRRRATVAAVTAVAAVIAVTALVRPGGDGVTSLEPAKPTPLDLPTVLTLEERPRDATSVRLAVPVDPIGEKGAPPVLHGYDPVARRLVPLRIASGVLQADGRTVMEENEGYVTLRGLDGSENVVEVGRPKPNASTYTTPEGIGASATRYVALSPDGRLLAAVVTRFEPSPLGGDVTTTRLSLFDVGTGDEVFGADLEEPGHGNIPPAWSPDSRRVAFMASPGLQLLDVGTKQLRAAPEALSLLGGDGMAFSPDGTRLLVSRPDGGETLDWVVLDAVSGRQLRMFDRALAQWALVGWVEGTGCCGTGPPAHPRASTTGSSGATRQDAMSVRRSASRRRARVRSAGRCTRPAPRAERRAVR